MQNSVQLLQIMRQVFNMKTPACLLYTLLLIGMELVVADPLVFGVLETDDPQVMRRRYQPLLESLHETLGIEVVLGLGHSRQEMLENLNDGTFHLGCLSSSSYVIAKKLFPEKIQLVASVEKNHREGEEEVAIIVRKDSELKSLQELEGKRFAFGSYQTTLSYYLPYYLLRQNGVLAKLESFDTLGAHEEIVAKRVAMGSYDAGAVSVSIARLYKKHLKTIARSEVISDSAIVVNRNIDPKVRKLIGSFFINMNDPYMFRALGKGVTGFVMRSDRDYDRLRKIMEIVDRDSGERP